MSSSTSAKPLPANVKLALEQGRVIEAIKLLRQAQGLGLSEAHDAVDRHRRQSTGFGHGPSVQPASDDGLPAEVYDALQRGEHALAVRLLRRMTKVSTREARRRIEQAAVGVTPLAPGLAPGEVPPTSSRLWRAVVALVLGYLLWRVLAQ